MRKAQRGGFRSGLPRLLSGLDSSAASKKRWQQEALAARRRRRAPQPRRHKALLPHHSKMPGGWDFQMSHGALGYQYKKDDDWLLSASMSAKSFADFGGLGAADYASGGNTAALRPSLSQDQLRASLPSLKIRSQERNPVLGCMPHDVIDTTDYVPTSHRLHGPMMLSKPRAAGSTTRFGVIVRWPSFARSTSGRRRLALRAAMLPKLLANPEVAGSNSAFAGHDWQNRVPSEAIRHCRGAQPNRCRRSLRPAENERQRLQSAAIPEHAGARCAAGSTLARTRTRRQLHGAPAAHRLARIAWRASPAWESERVAGGTLDALSRCPVSATVAAGGWRLAGYISHAPAVYPGCRSQAVVDVVQTKWNVMNGGPSSMSVMRPPLARD